MRGTACLHMRIPSPLTQAATLQALVHTLHPAVATSQQGPVPAPGTAVLLDVAAALSVCWFACTCAPGMSLAPGAEARAAVVAQLQAERTGRSGGSA